MYIKNMICDLKYILQYFDEYGVIELSNEICSMINQLRELKKYKIKNKNYYDLLTVLIECLKTIDLGKCDIEQLEIIHDVLSRYNILEITFDEVTKINLELKKYFDLML
jgi:hypothetical protein